MKLLRIGVLFLLLYFPRLIFSYEINETLSLDISLIGVIQSIDGKNDVENACRGANSVNISINFHPTEKDELNITQSYAVGNGLKPVNPFSIVSFSGDLENDLKNINGRNRDFLLEAWYKHKIKLTNSLFLSLTQGIIDATGYIDDNSYANDEGSQFMNEVFVNNPIANLPSYDVGGVIELEKSNFSIRGLLMGTKNEEGRAYNYFALQLGVKAGSEEMEQNYRIYGYVTGNNFLDRNGVKNVTLKGIGVSMDQKLSKEIGIFERLGWQSDKADVVNFKSMYSFGLNWRRDNKEVGVGYTYNRGVRKGIIGDLGQNTVFEGYYKFNLTKLSELTFDIQHIRDNYEGMPNVKGFIYGVRLISNF